MTEKIEWYKEVLELEPNSKVFFPLARLLSEAGRTDEAVEILAVAPVHCAEGVPHAVGRVDHRHGAAHLLDLFTVHKDAEGALPRRDFFDPAGDETPLIERQYAR